MSRNVSRRLLGSSLVLAAASFSVFAAEKSGKESAASALARKQVEAALRAEAAGDNERRAELLDGAIQAAPASPEANWHLGRVHISGKWLALAEAEQHAAHDSQLAEYRKLRAEAGQNPKLIRGLAQWCLKAGWKDTARIHYAQLLSASGIDLELRQEAIKRLDLYNVGGVWQTGEEIAAQRQKIKAIEEALNKWRPKLQRLQLAIDGDDFARRDLAIKELAQLNNPQLISVLESFLVDGGDRFHEEAVKRLAGFPHYEATEALVHYAVLSPYLSAREKATAALRGRSMFEYCPLLLGGLIAPLEAQFQIETARGGRVVYRQMLQRETPQVNQVAIADRIGLPIAALGARAPNSPERTILGRQLIQDQVAASQQTAALVNQQVGAANASAASTNRRITEVLQAATDQQLGSDPQQWWNWWQDYNQKQWPQVSQYVYTQEQYQYGYVPLVQAGLLPNGATHHSCFVAGTLVHTQDGPRAIETIEPGDRVLSQDASTGELDYKLITVRTIRPPGKLLRIHVGDEKLTTTPGHPFWVLGSGWRMAGELSKGDRLHALNGSLLIDEIEELPEPQQAYNLVVQDFNSYFVGKTGILVHDNEFRRPTHAIVPGLVDDGAVSTKK